MPVGPIPTAEFIMQDNELGVSILLTWTTWANFYDISVEPGDKFLYLLVCRKFLFFFQIIMFILLLGLVSSKLLTTRLLVLLMRRIGQQCLC
jgi:hypothetical protein